MKTLIDGPDIRPEPGDLVLARVDEIGKQAKLELTDGRRAHMFPGDEIVVCYGNRYAPDQYEAMIGPDLSPCDLVAAGGLASIELCRHLKIKPPTQITPIGLIGDRKGNRLNLRDFIVDASEETPRIPAILSLGTSMNAGKTLTATSMVRGFKRLGFKVAALKITGTGAGGDMWIVNDAGADISLDFTDAGYSATYLVEIPDLIRATNRLMNYAADQGCDVAVIEIADGLQQLETAQLIRHPAILDMAVGTVFAAYDAMGAKYGVDVLRNAGHSVLALSGRLGLSPLGVREAEMASGLRVYSPYELQDGALIPVIRERAAARVGESDSARQMFESLSAAVIPADIALGNVIHSIPGAANGRQIGRTGLTLARDILERTAEHVMSLEADAICGVPFGRRNRTRKDWRNGFVPKTWVTDYGEIALSVPRLKRSAYAPAFVEKAMVPVAAVRAVIEAPSDRLPSAVADLATALTSLRLPPEAVAPLVSNLRPLVDDARFGRPGWYGESGENEAFDADEQIRAGFVGASVYDLYPDHDAHDRTLPATAAE